MITKLDKALVAAAAAGGSALVGGASWQVALGAAIVAGGAVFGVPNKAAAT